MLSTGQANFSEKRWLENFLGNSGSSKPESRPWANPTVPSDRLRACWIESESRPFKFSENILSLRFEPEAAILSITASMVCLLVLMRTRSSDKSLTYPSTLTCLNPLAFRLSKRLENSPFLSTTMGDKSKNQAFLFRSEERRVGKECRSRWS